MAIEETIKEDYPLIPNLFKIVSSGASIFTGINAITSATCGNYDGAALCAGAAVYFGAMAYQFHKQAKKH
jgi:hypothetical protein